MTHVVKPTNTIRQARPAQREAYRILRRRRIGNWIRLAVGAMPLVSLFLTGCQASLDLPDRRLDGPNLSLKWTFDSGSPINQVPLRAADVVVFAPSGGPLTALDARTGTPRWQYDPPEKVWERSYATDGNSVFFGVGGGGLVAMDARTGSLEWQADLGIEVQLPPLVDAEMLYVPTTFVGPGIPANHHGRAVLFVLEAAHGNERRAFETDNYILQTPVIHGGTVYLAGNFLGRDRVEQGGHMRLYALKASDGTELWTYESEDGFPKTLYATSSTVAYVGYQDFVSGVDALSGRLSWRRDTGNWVPSLAGSEEAIYFGSANTVVHALNADSGEVLWQHNIEQGTFNYVLGSPVIVEDELYALTQHGDIIALDARDGTLRWKLSTGITSRVGMRVSDGWIFIGDENGVIHAYSDR